MRFWQFKFDSCQDIAFFWTFWEENLLEYDRLYRDSNLISGSFWKSQLSTWNLTKRSDELNILGSIPTMSNYFFFQQNIPSFPSSNKQKILPFSLSHSCHDSSCKNVFLSLSRFSFYSHSKQNKKISLKIQQKAKKKKYNSKKKKKIFKIICCHKSCLVSFFV